ELEEDDRGREPLARLRDDAVEAVERDDGVLERLRDEVLDLGRARPRVDDVDRDDGEGDVGEEVGAEPGEADAAEDQEGQRHHDGEDRTLDGDGGKVHRGLLPSKQMKDHSAPRSSPSRTSALGLRTTASAAVRPPRTRISPPSPCVKTTRRMCALPPARTTTSSCEPGRSAPGGSSRTSTAVGELTTARTKPPASSGVVD